MIVGKVVLCGQSEDDDTGLAKARRVFRDALESLLAKFADTQMHF
jgi:hypothetical protein